jgi:YbbR domain-containing protein
MRALTDHFGWKLLSLAIAVALWFMFVGEAEVATSMPVVVRYRNAPADLEITTEQPNRLFMKVRGPVSRLSAASLAETALVLDLANVHSPGEQTLSIDEGELGLPPGVTLLRVVPSQIRVKLERRTVKMLPVDVRYASSPPAGYRIVSQRVYPPTVNVIGPESHLTRLESVGTDPIDISSTIGESEFRVPVYLSDPQLSLESALPVTVVVSLEKIPQS